jgi:hypothetical protein
VQIGAKCCMDEVTSSTHIYMIDLAQTFKGHHLDSLWYNLYLVTWTTLKWHKFMGLWNGNVRIPKLWVLLCKVVIPTYGVWFKNFQRKFCSLWDVFFNDILHAPIEDDLNPFLNILLVRSLSTSFDPNHLISHK